MYAGAIRKGALVDGADATVDEDVATAATLQPLDFLDPVVAAAVVEHLLGRRGFMPPVEFWPAANAEVPGLFDGLRSTEPDALLRGDGWTAVVEAKCWAEFQEHQVEREIDLLLSELHRTGQTDGVVVLLVLESRSTAFSTFLGGGPATLIAELRRRVAAQEPGRIPPRWQALIDGAVTVEVVVVHWDEVLDALTSGTTGEAAHVQRMVAAVGEVLGRHGLIRPRAWGAARFARHDEVAVSAVRNRASSRPIDRLARHGAVTVATLPTRWRRRP